MANSAQLLVSPSAPLNSSTASLGEVDERVAVVLVERGADDPEVAQQPGLEQVQQPGQQLARGQVTGRAEEDDGRGWRRHATSLLLAGRKEKVWTGTQSPRWVLSQASADSAGSGVCRVSVGQG